MPSACSNRWYASASFCAPQTTSSDKLNARVDGQDLDAQFHTFGCGNVRWYLEERDWMPPQTLPLQTGESEYEGDPS